MTSSLIAQVDQAAKFTDAALSGVALGAIYALLALGLVLIFKATQVLNFAHGALAVFGAYFAAYFAVTLNFPGRLMGDAPVTLQIRHPGNRFVQREEREWPLARTQWTKFYLDPASHGLRTDAPGNEIGRAHV